MPMTLLLPNQSVFYMELKRVFALQSDFVSYRKTSSPSTVLAPLLSAREIPALPLNVQMLERSSRRAPALCQPLFCMPVTLLPLVN